MIQKNSKGYVVRVSENALMSMVLSSLEAYSVRKKDIREKGRPKARIEICGSLFGHEILMQNKKTLYQIEIAHVETTAEQRRSFVDESRDAITLKVDAITSFWPHMAYLGDFHLHPYKDKAEVLKHKGYFMSDGDREWLNEDFWKQLRYRVGLVVTLAAMERASMKSCDWIHSNCMEATLGNYRIWLAAYCAYSWKGKYQYTEDNDKCVMLDCPALTGLRWEHTDFGRFKNGKHMSL